MNENRVMNERLGLVSCMKSITETLKANRKRSAMRTYPATMHSYERFARQTGGSMAVTEVFTPGRLKEYEEYLRGMQRSWNTVSTYMRTLQAVYNRLVPPGTPERIPNLFKEVYTRVEPVTKRSLTEKQMEAVMSAKAAALSPALQQARAYFALMFMLQGMPFIDLAYMQKKDLKGNYLIYCRHKTGKRMKVRIPKEAAGLLQMYRNRDNHSIYLLPILKSGLKDDWEVYHCYQCALRDFNKSLAHLTEVLLPAGKLSSYTPRHTWATLAYHQGTPVGAICKALGHSSIRVTENYLRPFEDEQLERVNAKVIKGVMKNWKGCLFYKGG